ncbi:ABC transporter permease [Rhodoplanes elegans]|uniref:ABC transporter permease n=1 Tax=Rhodoplanes elegans TaxID=29408 RepID=A0A327K6B8_9BRAD|nr:iron ABC transporter permease [Rhodoplanes elegans]MBK5959048.1 ABC transporter permease [Rhodoplanes elegans]RAI33937.1 ABC transporter permease [Rhodoplanes elegans]
MTPLAPTISAEAAPRARAALATPGQWAVAAAIVAFLAVALVIPVGTVVWVAFTEKGTGTFTLVNFYDFARTDLLVRSTWNSIIAAAMTVALATVLALPLAVITTRFDFRGAALVQTLGFLPLIMPPFVGAVAMQLVFGRSGTINLLLGDWFDIEIPFMEGLNGVVFVEGVHYFPFILLNLSTALRTIDRSMEEAAQNLGSSGLRLFRRIVFPLAMPGYIAGASLVFVKVFDDLATPLLLNVKDMLAPQAYLRITSIGIADPMGYVISVVLVLLSVSAIALSMLAMRGRDYATVQRGGGGLEKRRLRPFEHVVAWGVVVLILVIVLAPHAALLMLSLATVWSYSPLPDGFTLAHYARVFGDSSVYITNTLLYASLAGIIDVVLGAAIAYLVLRTKLPGRQWLDWIAMAAVAVPGVVIGIGYLRTFYGIDVGGVPLATLWIVIVLALAVRRLPYALRACYAALQQVSVSLEEAAENLGATKARTIRRIVVPLISGGMLAGFISSFATASVELAATLMLVQSNSDAPLAYGLYVFMQSPAGRGPGAALGVIAVVLVAVCTFLSHLVVERQHRRQSRGAAGPAIPGATG